MSPQDIPPNPDGTAVLLLINEMFVVSARPIDVFQPGFIGLSEPQRSWMGVALTDQLQVEPYDVFSKGNQGYIGSMDIEIGFASTRKVVETPYDQDDLAKAVTSVSDHVHWMPMDTNSISRSSPTKSLLPGRSS